ncbi:universal stress protein [Cyanobacteria bacterium FACHB-DQ100]|uniref:universal stress protein n=1 Tax=unclassified Leptolyngbya TaxID=2650499 RepID=UPI001680D32E|nr:universal stress protein [Leptolyngbya sp. FACHB-17]MBD1824989.1 universal stress protein [Cyanobacteria bacterium FACHB-DQ100]MBD2080677.1 universal stress protein [Leptolyngbya sp. FACHB-17]
MLNTVLVALDVTANPPIAKSELSDQVLKTLQELHLEARSKVVLAHVVPSNQSEVEVVVDRPATAVEHFPYSQIEQQLHAYQRRLDCESAVEIVIGDPAEEIVRLAKIHNADLIVLGSRGLTGMKRILLGSVSSQIVEDAPCSVLVVKPK